MGFRIDCTESDIARWDDAAEEWVCSHDQGVTPTLYVTQTLNTGTLFVFGSWADVPGLSFNITTTKINTIVSCRLNGRVLVGGTNERNLYFDFYVDSTRFYNPTYYSGFFATIGPYWNPRMLGVAFGQDTVIPSAGTYKISLRTAAYDNVSVLTTAELRNASMQCIVY